MFNPTKKRFQMLMLAATIFGLSGCVDFWHPRYWGSETDWDQYEVRPQSLDELMGHELVYARWGGDDDSSGENVTMHFNEDRTGYPSGGAEYYFFNTVELDVEITVNGQNIPLNLEDERPSYWQRNEVGPLPHTVVITGPDLRATFTITEDMERNDSAAMIFCEDTFERVGETTDFGRELSLLECEVETR